MQVEPAAVSIITAMGEDGSEAGPSGAALSVTPEQLQQADSQYEQGVMHLRVGVSFIRTSPILAEHRERTERES